MEIVFFYYERQQPCAVGGNDDEAKGSADGARGRGAQ